MPFQRVSRAEQQTARAPSSAERQHLVELERGPAEAPLSQRTQAQPEPLPLPLQRRLEAAVQRSAPVQRVLGVLPGDATPKEYPADQPDLKIYDPKPKPPAARQPAAVPALRADPEAKIPVPPEYEPVPRFHFGELDPAPQPPAEEEPVPRFHFGEPDAAAEPPAVDEEHEVDFHDPKEVEADQVRFHADPKPYTGKKYPDPLAAPREEKGPAPWREAKPEIEAAAARPYTAKLEAARAKAKAPELKGVDPAKAEQWADKDAERRQQDVADTLGAGHAPASDTYLGQGEGREARLMQMDPRLEEKYQLNREVDTATGGRWAKLKAKGAVGKAVEAVKSITKRDVARAGVGLLPLVGTGLSARSAWEERNRQKADEEVAKAPEASPLTQSIAAGRAREHQVQKRKKVAGTAASLLGDAVTIGTLGAGGALGAMAKTMGAPLVSAGSEAVGGTVVNVALKPTAILSGSTKVAGETVDLAYGAKYGKEGETRQQALLPKSPDGPAVAQPAGQAPAQADPHAQVDQANEALLRLPRADPDYGKALIQHLQPGQLAIGQELAANRAAMDKDPAAPKSEVLMLNGQRITGPGRELSQSTASSRLKRAFRRPPEVLSQTVSEPNLRPSEVAKLAASEQARIRERQAMGAEPTWSLAAERAQPEGPGTVASLRERWRNRNQPAAQIPAAPALEAGAQPESKGPDKENFLKKLALQEETKFYD